MTPLRSGTVVMITGASGGVGRATARLLAGRGARLGLLARGRDGLEGARKEVEAAGGQALVLPADVSQPDEVEAAAAQLESAFGPIDLWINNAMVSLYSPFMEMTAEEFRHVVDVTFLGVVHGTRAALRRMQVRDRGTIIQVGSALAFRSIPLQSAYCASKHAINGFTEALRSELIHAKSRVRLSVVHMPALNTTQFTWTLNRMRRKVRPAGRIFQPELAAQAILFVAEHPRRAMEVGHTTVEAVLGEKIFPGLLDHYLARTAWEGALLPEADDPTRPDNFWQPVPADLGCHGKFASMSHRFSVQLWATEHRFALLTGAAVVIAAVVALCLFHAGALG
ncbi:MAG TPA: SDR family oxidoreductase [Candidatus Didemnitutus sp.]|nr:SDR family oxidoreductase [Candidatus Didemnitutus sp.]